MKFLVTGAAGQLGRETVLALEASGVEVVGLTREQLDFSRPEQVAEGIAAQRADWVINCAAYTQVDKAETDQSLAFLVNRDSAAAVANGVKHSGGRLVHISTDFIFSGEQSHPYSETDPAAPLGVYGQSKWEGEQAVMNVLPQALVVRTAWVYGMHGNNFVKTMLRLMAERDEISVVDDQIGTPSWTGDIVRAMQTLIENDAAGIYHFSNEGVASWYDLAYEILSAAPALAYPVKTQRLLPVPSSQWPCAAKRPPYSVLGKEKIRPILGYDIPHWRQSLRRMLKGTMS